MYTILGKMRGLVEFAKQDLINNQLQMAETFETMHKITSTDQECLNLQKADYAKESADALRLMWYLFQDNHILLSEADLKDESYYTENIFKKVKEQYSAAMTALSDLKRTTKEETAPSERDELVDKQRHYFSVLQDLIKNINIDELHTKDDMEECQRQLHDHWNPIENDHSTIRNKFAGLMPDVTYELSYVQYKNMYQTTLSLLNYKIDIVCYPLYRIIPHVGIPTWRMFDMYSEVPAFSVTSVVWEKFQGLGELIRNNKISEGDKRQLLIRTFLTYQTPLNRNPGNIDGDSSDDESEEQAIPAPNPNEEN